MADDARVLVTGGAGFIGANMVRLLLDEGYDVTVLDDLSAGRAEHLEGLALDFVERDIRDPDAVVRVVDGSWGVVHLAAQTGVPGSIADPRRDCEVNVTGTMNVLEACRAAGVGRFVFASSNAPLGRQKPPATEDKAPLPISPYGASKLAGEAYCLAYHGSWDVGTVALRFGNVFGPWCGHKSSVVARFFKDFRDKGEITIDGSGDQTRDFVFVGDLCRAMLLALRSDVAGEVFQISTGVETSVNELAGVVERVVGERIDRGRGPPRTGDIVRNYAVVTKAERMLGWRPQVSLAEGLRATWEWMQQHS